MNNPYQMIANAFLQRHPEIRNNPQKMEWLNIISSGDSKRGEEIATNLLNTYGISKEQAIDMIKNSANSM